MAGIFDAVGSILGGGETTSSQTFKTDLTETTRRGSGQIEDFLADLVEGFTPDFDEADVEELQNESIQRASGQVSGILEGIFDNFRTNDLANIFASSESAGVFGSSGTQQLADRAFADASRASSEVVLSQANTLAQQVIQNRAQREQFLTALFNADINATASTRRKGTQSQKGTQFDPLRGINTAIGIGQSLGGGQSAPGLFGFGGGN